jgi:hypothetical protein
MRTVKLLAIVAGLSFVAGPVLAEGDCGGFSHSVKIKTQTVQVESSKPVVKPEDKKS